MAASSSDDDAPIIQRLQGNATKGEGSKQDTQVQGHNHQDDDEDADTLPEWARLFKSPYKGGYKPPLPSSSDDDGVMDLTKDTPAPAARPQAVGEAGPSQAPVLSQAPHASQPAVAAAGRGTPRSTGRGRGRGRGRAGATRLAETGAADLHGPSSQPPAALVGAHTAAEEQPGAMDVDETEEQPASQQAAMPDSQAPAAGLLAAKPAGGRGRAAQQLPPGAELPVMMPERVPHNKLLVELPSSEGQHEEAVDLAGDAGAVGRLIITGKPGSAEMVVDLKGVMFNASVVPLQATALVINIQPAEARVEAVLNDCVQLRAQGGGWGVEEEAGGGLAGLLGSDDEDDHYGAAAGAGAEDGEDDKKVKKLKKKGAAAAKGSKPRGGAKAGAGKGGKAGAAKASGKGLGAKGGVAKKRKPAGTGTKKATGAGAKRKPAKE